MKEEKKFKWTVVNPVSYTHLDVYKRQQQGVAIYYSTDDKANIITSNMENLTSYCVYMLIHMIKEFYNISFSSFCNVSL